MIQSGTMVKYAMTLSIEALEHGKWRLERQPRGLMGLLLFLAESGVYGVGWTCGFTFCEAYINIFDMSTQLHQTDVQAKDRNLYAIFQIRIKSRKCNNELQTHL